MSITQKASWDWPVLSPCIFLLTVWISGPSLWRGEFLIFYFNSMQCRKTFGHEQGSWSDQLQAGYHSRPGNNCCPWATNIKSNSLHRCDSGSRKGVPLDAKLQAVDLLPALSQRMYMYSEARSEWQCNCEVLCWWWVDAHEAFHSNLWNTLDSILVSGCLFLLRSVYGGIVCLQRTVRLPFKVFK